jgi:molybdopterin/thiamine biosynthesis adenylyltransferase
MAEPDQVLEVRTHADLWRAVEDHVRDFSSGEQAGFLVVRTGSDTGIAIGQQFLPIPEQYVLDREHGLNWDGRFNLRVVDFLRKDEGAMLVHAHPHGDRPALSPTDRVKGADLLGFLQRRQPEGTHGLIVLGRGDAAAGEAVSPSGRMVLRRVVVPGDPRRVLFPEPLDLEVEDPSDRQYLALGPVGESLLTRSAVGVVGVSGGGSHVCQQLIHAGVGTLIVIDPELVDRSNLRRLVGAVQSDVDKTAKVRIPHRMAAAVRPTTRVVPIAEPFPSRMAIDALRMVDLIVGCVDGWDTRDDLNRFCLEQRIPYLDIGALISPATETRQLRVNGQVALVLPGGPCLRCMDLVTDARVEASRQRRQGYGEDLHDPQVVSVNGILASSAVTTALLLIAGEKGLPRFQKYAWPPGHLTIPVGVTPRAGCSACRRTAVVS